MRSPWSRSRPASILVLACSFVIMASCRAPLLTHAPAHGNTVAAFQCALLDPFRPVDQEQFTRANSAMTLVNHRFTPVSSVVGKKLLTMEDCRNIALTNNLNIQVARLEEFSRKAIEYSNQTKMLPRFLFYADLSQRDKQTFSYSDVLGQEGRTPRLGGTSEGVTDYYTSHERSTWRYSLEARWSPTDAALAYFLTKSSANDRLKAHYQRVRIAQQLIANVDGAYFRLLSLQKSLSAAEQLVSVRSGMADKIKELLDKKIVAFGEYDKAKQRAIRARRLLDRIRNQVEKQRNILASAMALSPNYWVDGGFRVRGSLSAPSFRADLSEMEMRAVQNRPEAFEAGLNHLNSINDIHRTIVKYYPKLSFFARYTHDKDKFLLDKDWNEIGVSIYFDLVDWLTNKGESAATKFDAAKTRRRMGMVALGIASQLRTVALDYHDALNDFQSKQDALSITEEAFRVASKRTYRDELDKLSLEEAKANVLEDTVSRNTALGEVNAALAELYGTMGTNYNEPAPRDAVACAK